MLGERPKKSGIIKPLPRLGRERGRGDWRLKGWEKALRSHDWPVVTIKIKIPNSR
jgi:hypothetical protein